MDLSHGDNIDTLCQGCNEPADGWAFRSDGTRVYVCSDCAGAIHRYTPDENIGAAPHPRAMFCTSCDRLTYLEDLTHQRRCPDCKHGAAERDQGDGEPDVVGSKMAVAAADAQGAIDWDEDE